MYLFASLTSSIAFWRCTTLVSFARPLAIDLPLFSKQQKAVISAMANYLRATKFKSSEEPATKGLDLPLVLGSEPFKLYLLFYDEHWLLTGILSRLPPSAHMLREESSLTAVGAELSFIKASRLRHHRVLVGGAPAFWFIL
jgi:hypothetical protein